MTHGSLFSGIGGFEMAADRVGIKTLWNCEIEEYPSKILKQSFPNVRHYTDIRKSTGFEKVDIISGGFPCQDISSAGKMGGIRGSRSGLWGEMHRIIGEVRPRYVIIENSPLLVRSGFEVILRDLAALGFDAQWQVISNLAFGYPHKRERLYVIAYPRRDDAQTAIGYDKCAPSIFKQLPSDHDRGYVAAKGILDIANCDSIRVDDGVSDWAHRIKAIGNAVNVDVAEYLFDCVRTYNEENYER